MPVDMLTYREGYALGQVVRLARDRGSDGLAVLDPNGTFFEGSLRALKWLVEKIFFLAAKRRPVKTGPASPHRLESFIEDILRRARLVRLNKTYSVQ